MTGMTQYISSIVNKYGDTLKVNDDVMILNEIIARQGASLLIDVIAEQAARTANEFKFLPSDRSMTMVSLLDELEEALKERL